MEHTAADLIRSLMIDVNRIDGIYYQWARQTGLKENMLSLLYALSDGNTYTQKQISEEWLIPKTTINTVVKECISKGYVRLKQEPHTKEKSVCLTKAGREYTDAVLKNLKLMEVRALEETLKKYPPQFVEALNEFTFQFQESLSQIRK